ncbi:alpha/beta-hydrolase [Hypoxylon trugodes]|uniref:alpha/beta-hydrolase n=1 Tax=Hypoxylon trugodes TaxID=326681 RepID=UPI00219DDC6B|nr:alpha/beta-hydrolase [Hypoxylon trugodes]KAI1392638.1 alpha/beta-hydrolase [Hypoxylon trugodes]
MATNIVPYNIAFPPSEVNELKQRLLNARFPGLAGENNWDRGPPIRDIRRLATHWRESFNFSQFEEKLNQLNNYEATVSVDGFDPFQLHFIHHKSAAADAIPLLFIHGWPGSFIEVTKILPLLAKSDPAFHVIAPSLPNYGFSGLTPKPGFGIKQYAEACLKLMQGLGYEKFATQGGDWGSIISRTMGVLYPESVLALHLNLVMASAPTDVDPADAARVQEQHKNWMETGDGYYKIQRQRPNTIGIALADSPVGLLTWIYDKLVAWTDEYPWTDDEVCEWLSIYWFSRAGPAASVTIYHEVFRGEFNLGAGIYPPRNSLIGFSYFPKEIMCTPSSWNKQLGDVVFERKHERGGHFAAWEKPEDLVGDLRDMFARGGRAYAAFQAKQASGHRRDVSL